MSANNTTGACPLCGSMDQMGARAQALYGHLVCKKCYTEFATRRQAAFILDVVFMKISSYFIGFCLGVALTIAGIRQDSIVLTALVVDIMMIAAFLMKDGFGGRSPGKALMDLQVVDASTGKPTGFSPSLRRNLITAVPFMPLLVAFDLKKGSRIGDGWAGTKVIWGRHKNTEPFRPPMQRDDSVETPMAA